MTHICPNGVYYRGQYKARRDSETGRWFVIYRPTAAILSAHDERDHAIAEAEQLAVQDHAEGRR